MQQTIIIALKSICLAPVNHALCRFAAAYTLVGKILLLKGDTSGTYTCNFLYLILTSLVAAPHSLDKAVAVLFKRFGYLVHGHAGIGASLTVLECCLVKSVMYLGKLGLNGICDAVQRYKALLTVVTCYYYALVLLDILGAYLNSERNTLHLVLSKLPAGRVVAVIDLYSDACCLEDICHLVSLVENALLELLDRNDNCLNGCYCGRKNKSVVVAVGHNNCADKTGGHAPRSLVRIR